MRAASSGLRHPASASCLGRHSHLAGRCPNNSSLFPPLAAVVVVAAERLFLIEQCRSVCGRSGIAFSRVGSWRETAFAVPLSAKARRSGINFLLAASGLNSFSQSLTALPAPSGREPLARPHTLHFSRKLSHHAKGPILEGAGIA